MDAGRRPEQFGRLWLHTHPGDSPTPSATDEETFHRVFGRCQWAVIFIVGQSGKTYARLSFSVGPGGQVVIPTEVCYARPFEGSDLESWEAEYKANVKKHEWPPAVLEDAFGLDGWDEDYLSMHERWREDLEAMDPEERKAVLADLIGQQEPGEGTEVWDEF